MPPVTVTRPVSGLLGAGDQPQQRRLAAAVAADDADPLAVGDAERHPVEHGRGAVGLARPFSRLTRFGHQRRRSPRAGHGRRRDRASCGRRRARPVPSARSRAASACAHRNAQVGPEPDTMPPSAPSSAPAASDVAAVPGAATARRGCRSLASDVGQPPAVAARAARRAARPARRSGRARCRRRASGRARGTPPAVEMPKSASANTQWYSPVASTGVSCSPRPVPSAVPPISGNATSLPSRAASSASSGATSRCATARRRRPARRRRRPSRRPSRRRPGSPCAGRAGRRRRCRCVGEQRGRPPGEIGPVRRHASAPARRTPSDAGPSPARAMTSS